MYDSEPEVLDRAILLMPSDRNGHSDQVISVQQ